MKLKPCIIFASIVFVAVIALCSPVSAGASSRTNVLFVFSWHQGMPWQAEIERGFKEHLKNDALNANLFFEYMDAGRFMSVHHPDIFEKYLSEKYKDHRMDYVIFESGPANKLFYYYPDLFENSKKYIVNPDPIHGGLHNDGSTVIPVTADYEKTVQHLLAVSKGKTIYLVAGATEAGKERVQKTTEITLASAPQKRVVPLIGLPMDQLIKKVSNLEPDSVIFYLLVFEDGKGNSHIPYDAAKQISSHANVPVYSLWTSLMGSGIAGGYMLSGELVGKKIAAIITDPDLAKKTDYANLADEFHGYYYDWRQLKRWGIEEKSLPPGSKILFKDMTFFERYRRVIVLGSLSLVLIISFIWIGVLSKEISKRKKIERELQDSENRYRGLSDASFEGILVTKKGKIIDANKTLEEMFGYSLEEAVGMNAADLMASSEREDVLKKVLSGYERSYETLGRKKDGSIFPIEIHAKMVSFQDRQVRVSAVRDLSEQKKAQTLLMESEKRLIEAQKVAKMGYYVFNIKTGYWTNSPELDKLFGIGKSFNRNIEGWKQIIHPDHQEEMIDYLQVHVIGNHQKFDREYKIINQSNQKEYWVHGRGDLKLDAEGAALEMFGTIQDITQRRQMEKELRESQQNMASVLNNTHDLIVRLDRNFRHIFANPALYAATGLSPEEYLGKTNEEIGMPEELSHFFKTKHEKVLATGKPEVFTFGFRARNESLKEFQAVVTPEFNTDGEVETVISIMRDITELKQAESEKNRIIKELEKTLSEVKTLRGLIPICSRCKKIRDDQGYWNNLETFLEEHSDASFSHGMCQGCLEELYGQEDWYIKRKQKEESQP